MEARVQALETALAAAEAKVSAVTVKLPPFWPDKALLWFAQAEAQFTIKNITTSKTKYAHAMTMLDSKTAELAMDIIANPPDDNPYEALKTRLTNAYSISDDEKADRLLDIGAPFAMEVLPNSASRQRLFDAVEYFLPIAMLSAGSGY